VTVPDVRKLLAKLSAEEERFRAARFVAPCVRGGRLRARVAGLVCTFTPEPRDFQGWGIFQPTGGKVAEVVEEADLPLVARYLGGLPRLRLWLAEPLEGQTWLAYPASEGDARQRLGGARPLLVRLVTEGTAFEPVVARGDGRAWWFEEVDRRADPRFATGLREALQEVIAPEQLRLKGLTPEMRAAYDLAAQRAMAFRAQFQERRDQRRLRGALELAGGELREFRDRGDFWQVEWTTCDGQRHTSAIGKRDLTVISSGICLSGHDRDFDLQSLVGVMDGQWE
jgi:hypothetical protein